MNTNTKLNTKLNTKSNTRLNTKLYTKKIKTGTVQDSVLKERYEDLANAVILQAVEDYRLTDREGTLRKIERFFRSEWSAVLTKMDPEYLITELRKEKQ